MQYGQEDIDLIFIVLKVENLVSYNHLQMNYALHK